MLKDFKPVLFILLRFIAVYLVLLGLYQWYLNGQTGLDGFSQIVARQSNALQNLCGYKSYFVMKNRDEMGYFFVVNRYVMRMAEGCNAVSVMILFAAFLSAFWKGAKTLLFGFFGVLILHLINVIRIAGINIVAFLHPELEKSVHDYVFPAIIYGSVVLLWIIWIKKFALKDEKK